MTGAVSSFTDHSRYSLGRRRRRAERPDKQADWTERRSLPPTKHAFEAALPAGVRVATEWAWKPGDDEFIPDVMVFSDRGEDVRYTHTPYLVVETLCHRPDDRVELDIGPVSVVVTLAELAR